MNRKNSILESNNKKITLGKKTAIMGIVNITPDSFADESKYYNNIEKVLEDTKQMLKNGADIIDIGGESTRPGASPVSEKEELRRVIPVIESVRNVLGNNFFISIDTYKAAVAKTAVSRGADIINDVSGLQLDSGMIDVVVQTHAPVILNHMKGNPKTMQKGKIVYDNVIKDIHAFFATQIQQLKKRGVTLDKIILDPGFGFGKTVAQNITLVTQSESFSDFGVPLLLGVSRKSALEKLLQQELGEEQNFPPQERIEASLALTAVGILHGIHIIRTHDVAQTKRFVSVLDATINYV